MEKYLLNSAEKAVIENLCVPMAVYQFTEKRVVTLALSKGFLDLYGCEDKDFAYYLMDNDMYRDAHPDDVARIANAAVRFATEGGDFDVVYRTKTLKDDGYRIIHSFGKHVVTDDGVRLAYVWYSDEGLYSDDLPSNEPGLNRSFSTSLHEESIVVKNHFDFLTGLPSMTYFFELAEEWMKSFLVSGGTAAIMFLDLSGLKFFNRKHGFAKGDELLRRFANLLKKQFSNENCCRFGSDHFCVYTDAQGLEEKLEKIFEEFADDSDGYTLPVRAGIYLDKTGAVAISTACDRAKFACDSMRNSYISIYCYFNDAMLLQAEGRQYIIDNLDLAIRENWIETYYQPIIRAANGRVCAEEAIARWNDPIRGMLLPDEFIPVLEESRLIYKLDLYVLEQVLKKIKRQREEGLYVVPGVINLSRVDFDVCDIVEEVRRLVDESGINREMINIEVTENVLGRDFDYIKSRLERFRELGFRVWMDDFGSGYSSLDIFRNVRFDVIKLEKRFMDEFNDGGKSRIILTELVKMAASLDLDSVCEGVVTKEQAGFLREIGCTMLQGDFYCEPMPLEKTLELYKDGRNISFENPAESEYYSAIGRLNLYDPAIIVNNEPESFRNYFNALPMAIYESRFNDYKLLRCNNSFRAFLQRTIGRVPFGEESSCVDGRNNGAFMQALGQCADSGITSVPDVELADHSSAHILLKHISRNPVNGTRAIAVAILAVTDDMSSPSSEKST